MDKPVLTRTKMALPKANVVRISVLSAADRERYLGTLDSAIDATIKQTIYNKVYSSIPVFYGILQGSGDFSIGMTPNWNKSTSGASIGGMLRSIATSKDNSVGKVLGYAGDILKATTGINASATGSATMKSYEGSDLSAFSIDVGWYLPEQMALCRHSLQVLMRMGYPVQVPDTGLADAMGAVVGAVEKGTNDAKSLTPGKSTPVDQQAEMEAINVGVSNAGLIPTVGANVITYVNNLLGVNLVLDPIPVRCSIGHYADVEPLVIEDIKVVFSKDTFVEQSTGRHLPVKCTVTIQFKFWLTPAPKLEFMELLGKEMFGEGITNINAHDTSAAKDNVTQNSQPVDPTAPPPPKPSTNFAYQSPFVAMPESK